jgi:hypothetical protein
MKTRIYRPKGVRTDRHPTAHRIADQLLQHGDVLRLTTGLLVRDITTTHHVAHSTAMRAVGIARTQTA